MPERGDGEVEKMLDFGRPVPLGPGEGEAFLENGLLRTDMSRWHSELSNWDDGRHGMLAAVESVLLFLTVGQSCKH